MGPDTKLAIFAGRDSVCASTAAGTVPASLLA